jgi:hypothetical protein
MPRTTRRGKRPTERRAAVPDEILNPGAPDRPMTAEEIDTAGRRLKKALRERMLGGELSYHLGGALDTSAEGSWGRRFPTIVKIWRQAWEHVIPVFAFPPAVRGRP